MTTVVDPLGRTVDVTIDEDGLDLYQVDGITLSFLTGTPLAQALAALGGLGPDDYVAPKVNWTFLEFMGLLTADEQSALVSSSDPQIRIFILMAAGSVQLQLSDPRVVAGVAYAESVGIFTGDRVTQILSGQPPPS